MFETQLVILCHYRVMKKLLSVFFLLMTAWNCQAQDPKVSQPFSNPIYLNPAFAGFDGSTRLTISYRNQCPSTSCPFQTVNTSYDQYVKPLHGGIAINYQYDTYGEGLLRAQNASFAYAPTFRLFNRKLTISPAIGLGWRARYFNVDKLTFGNNFDARYGIPYFTFGEEKPVGNFNNVFYMNLGILFAHHGLVYGAAFSHINTPNIAFNGEYRLPVRYTAHISYVGKATEKFKISPSVVFFRQQDFLGLSPALSFSVFGVRTGLGYDVNFNNPDAFVFLFGYQGKRISTGYSLDIRVSPLTNAKLYAHEISFNYLFNCKNRTEHAKGERQIAF